MKKIKFFLDPISHLGPWLNDRAKQGYRLKSLNNFIYDFEKTAEPYQYSTQFIGANASADNVKYIHMLKENGTRVFRAPVNQGSLVFGKIRLRPYAEGSGKFANSFQDYNKEILVVENAGEEILPLLSNVCDLAGEYRNIRNGYLQATILMLCLFVLIVYKAYISAFDIGEILRLLLGLLALCFLSFLLAKAQLNYLKYKRKSEIEE